MVRLGRGQAGHTLIEMVVTISVMAIFASVILPLAAVTRKREKEIELRRALREVRTALDMYHELCLSSGGAARPQTPPQPGAAPVEVIQLKIENDPGRTCWPEDLEVLLEGAETQVPRYKLRFLRRVPKDPFNLSEDEHDGHGWVFRSSTDDPERASGWDRQNVFDIRSASESQALDGSFYQDW